MSAGSDPSFNLRVRPYLLTQGRTRGAVDLPMEALVRTTPSGHRALPTQSPEKRTILELCAQPQSVAELSAKLHVHLQVARVLVGDLLGAGLVATRQSANEGRPDVELLEKVLSGLQGL